MKKKLRGLIWAGLVGLLIGLAASLVSIQGQDRQERPPGREDRFREWSERRREAADADARVVLEARLVKLEVDLANERKRLDWMEKVAWGAIVGILGLFGREVLSVYFNRQNRRQADRDSHAGDG
jgi:hypothetical protein